MTSEQKSRDGQSSKLAENKDSAAAKPEADSEAPGSISKRLKRWLIRYGPIGVFLFFLIKGLVWVALAVLAWWGLRGT